MAHIQTILGPVELDALGLILPHEHLYIQPVADDPVPVEIDDVVRVMLPYLEAAAATGVTAFVECSPTGMQNVDVIEALAQRTVFAQRTPVAIVMPVGLYKHQFPREKLAYSDSELTDWMVMEITEGIGDSEVRAGFIKMAVTDEGITDVEARNLHAAARAARATGVLVASHTSGRLGGEHALEELDILASQGLPGEQFNWVHAQHASLDFHKEAAARGAYIGFDNLRPEQEDRYVKLVLDALEAGLADRILLSHDAGWYRAGEPDGGQIRGFTYLVEGFLPRLRREGVGEDVIKTMTEANPARAFRVR